mmetsp:Transcript_11826/g.25617  ORF Transcript_11826/g.25617 Transcript_11826/m.25617 type:complete len:104 (+) Transcript_11826:236-547(+)
MGCCKCWHGRRPKRSKSFTGNQLSTAGEGTFRKEILRQLFVLKMPTTTINVVKNQLLMGCRCIGSIRVDLSFKINLLAALIMFLHVRLHGLAEDVIDVTWRDE